MDMKVYLKEIEFAVTPIITAIWYEHAELQEKYDKLAPLFSIVDVKSRDAQKKGFGYFGAEAHELILINGQADTLKRKILARRFAVAALSGTLLQFAKQAISIVHDDPKFCPEGRFIGSQSLRSVIWHGRNQSAHWDEKKGLNPRTKACFMRLCFEFGFLKFAGFQNANLSFEIINLLDWKTFENFRDDLLLLGESQ